MKKNKLYGLIICLSALASCSNSQSLKEKLAKLEKEEEAFLKKIEAIKVDSLRDDAKKFGSMLFFFRRIDLENQQPPKDTVYEENPFQILEQYPSPVALTQQYLQSLVVENNGDYSSKRALKIHRPFFLPFQEELNWDKVNFPNNVQQPVVESLNEAVNTLQVVKTNWNNDPGLDINYPVNVDPSTMEPVSVSGSINAIVPKSVLQFKFKNNEKGDTKEQNGIKVKLASIKGHMVSVEVTNPNPLDRSVDPDKVELIKVVASDKTGGFLDQSGSSTGSDELLKRYDKILDQLISDPENIKDLEKQMEKEDAEYEKKYKHMTFYKTYYRGSVEEVIVYVMDYSKATKVQQAVNLKAYSFKHDVENRSIEQIPLNTTVYNPELAKQLSEKPEIGASELQKLMAIDQKAYEKETGAVKYESNGQLTFRYPKVLSSMFLSDFERYGKLKEIKFLTEKDGKVINYPKDSVDFDDEYVERKGEPWAEYTVNRIEYNPTKFSVRPKYVTGTIEVNLSAVRKSSFSATQLPIGMQVQGNMLIIDESVLDNRSIYHVKDKTGKYLKELTYINYKKGDGYNYKRENVHYYYGIPATVERYEAGETTTADYKFAVELLPEKP